MASSDSQPTSAVSGVLVDHGQAIYHQKVESEDSTPNEGPGSNSYYVTLENRHGNRFTLWGRDLERVMGDVEAKAGERIRLERERKEGVKVDKPVYDEQGNVEEMQQIEAQRTVWNGRKIAAQQHNLEQHRDVQGTPTANVVENSHAAENHSQNKAQDKDKHNKTQAGLPDHLADKYIMDEQRVLDEEGNWRFSVTERRIKSADTGSENAADMIAVAAYKGWSKINVKGEKEFKRNAWVEATARGMETEGYSPSQEDKDKATALREAYGEEQAKHNERNVRAQDVRSMSPDAFAKKHPELHQEASILTAAQTFAHEKMEDSQSQALFDETVRADLARRVETGRSMHEVQMKDIKVPEQQAEQESTQAAER